MMNRPRLFLKLLVLVACLMCAMSAQAAAEAYACYTASDSTLTFYYDNQRSSRPGTTYDLNMGENDPGWYSDGTYLSVTQAVFNSSFAEARPTSTYAWFNDMKNLTSITGMQYLNTTEVTDMSRMFAQCESLSTLDVSGFNTANVTKMNAMFDECISLVSLDLSGFNTANVTDMSYMFYACVNLTSLDVSHFNTANVTNMYCMFACSWSLTSLDVSHFNTAKVTNMCGMFGYCSGLTSLDLSSFTTANVTDMSFMFRECSALLTIYVGSSWTTAAVTDSYRMFHRCTKIRGGQGTTYDANHTDAEYAHIDGGPDNPGYFTDKHEAYAVYTEDNTTLTFYYDTQRDTRPGITYDLNTGRNQPEWINDEIYESVNRVVFEPSFAAARPVSTYMWFYCMENVQSIEGIEYLNTSEVTNMGAMFMACSGLTNLDVSHFNTDKATDMFHMFYGCSNLTSLDVRSFNTTLVGDMRGMFRECSKLTSLDLSSFNTANVEIMSMMFKGDSHLTTIYVGDDWSTAILIYSIEMFSGCTSLVGGQGTTYDANHIDAAYAHIDGGPDNPGYFTEKVDFIRGDVDGDGSVRISDVTALIRYLLSQNATGINLAAADADQDGNIRISDVTALIRYLLSQKW